MKNTVHYNLCIVIAIISIDLMLGQSSAHRKKTGNSMDAANIDAFAKKIQLILFKGNSIDTAEIMKFPIKQPELLYFNLDLDDPSLIYVHGYQEDPFDKKTQAIVGAHLKRGETNVWLLDWSKFSHDDYETIVENHKIIAQIFANALTELVELGFDIDDCHLVAHSLGAQIAGILWKYMEHTLPRITGIDPANPGFPPNEDGHIDHRSARFVAIIHADKGYYGYPQSVGTVDFYPNGGKRPQPGCPRGDPILNLVDFCSHFRAWQYYVESVNHRDAFLATQCDSYKNYLDGECLGNRVIIMGYGTPSDAHGTYYLTTGDKSPFGEIDSD